ncbi:hypothetical protein [Roseisalinus antarcticus]|uniref:Uncharacterized protein n=1 Tax=Roseisalinus antarcticus TaxID=254357 RepID=A0A1Y5TU68_9RHOB|nr:hypothetical protein [Roseisalinus antarcticus]SLN72393.1 hypothetical protein ROA7023_03598 [Roseisalinus antarcticus]
MARIIETFCNDENGNATTDWLVLAAGVLMLGTAIFATVAPDNRDLASDEGHIVLTEGV